MKSALDFASRFGLALTDNSHSRLVAAADERAFGWHTPSMPHRPAPHRWYCTAGWQRRRAHQLAVAPLCQLCLERGIVTPATIADHDPPHRGDFTAFSSANSAACAP